MSIISHSAAAGRIRRLVLGIMAFAALVIGGATPSPAAANPGIEAAPQVVSEFSAARRQHRAVRSKPRNAYGRAADSPAPQSPSFGYGVGDNSQHQTW